MKTVAHEAALLAARFKALERGYCPSLPAGCPYAVRLDGVSFKRFTAGMQKPFDPRLTRAMLLTARDLMERCAARTAFCQSDEITLVFAGEPLQSQIMYAGRVSKIVSVTAALATARFNHHIARLPWDSPQTRDLACSGSALFDARAFALPDDQAAMGLLWWRHKHDMRRNVVNTAGFHALGHQALDKQPIGAVLETLRSTRGLDPFSAYPAEAMFGAFLKKAQVAGEGYNPVLGTTVPCTRTRIEGRTFDWEQGEADRVAMTMAKFWEPAHPASLHPMDALLDA